jgi:nitrogen regulatory protein PII
MKSIEVVITPWSLDTFKEAAPRLGIAEFDLVEVYRSDCTTIKTQKRLYRGREFTADLLPCLKLEFVLFDEDVQTTLDQLIELVNPESVAIFGLDQALRPTKGHLTNLPQLNHTTNRPKAKGGSNHPNSLVMVDEGATMTPTTVRTVSET